MNATDGELRLIPESRPESTVLTVTGTLNRANCSHLREGLLKVATGSRDFVIADIGGLTIRDRSLVPVFAVIARRISDWPGIPFAIVSSSPEHRMLLASTAVDSFVALHPDVETAERARDHPPRRQAVQDLAATDVASAFARRFVERVCEEWRLAEYAEDVALIATELVENTIRHTVSRPKLKLELRHGLLSVAVADDDPHEAVLLERRNAGTPGMGLRLVADTARVWGCSRSWWGGKVVWAVVNVRGPPWA
jgi:anti-anti-sigma regulatory factor